MQQSEESVQSYVTRLRKLAASCKYGALTDKLIRGRLVIGLKNQGDKVRFLREKSLDLKKAIQMCNTSEIASQQIKTIVGAGDNKTEDVKKFSEKKFPYRSSKKRDGGRSSNSENKSEKRNPKVLSNRPVSIAVVNNAMKNEQSVPRLRKRAVSKKGPFCVCMPIIKEDSTIRRRRGWQSWRKLFASGNCVYSPN